MADPAAADGAAAAAPLASTLPDELKARFNERLQLTALVVPKQRTTEYMKLLSKWVVIGLWWGRWHSWARTRSALAVWLPARPPATAKPATARRHLFNKPRMRNVVDGPTPDTRLLLLEEGLGEAGLGSRQVDGGRTLAQLAADDGLAVSSTEVAVDYRYWPAHNVLQVCCAPSAGVGWLQRVHHACSLLLLVSLCMHCPSASTPRLARCRPLPPASGCCPRAWRCRRPLRAWETLRT